VQQKKVPGHKRDEGGWEKGTLSTVPGHVACPKQAYALLLGGSVRKTRKPGTTDPSKGKGPVGTQPEVGQLEEESKIFVIDRAARQTTPLRPLKRGSNGVVIRDKGATAEARRSRLRDHRTTASPTGRSLSKGPPTELDLPGGRRANRCLTGKGENVKERSGP